MAVYDELGIRPFINAWRPLTRLGGAVLPEPVAAAMQEASRGTVDLRALQRLVGAAIAAMTGNEAVYVSSGAAAGITLAIAACMAGTNPLAASRLPDTRGLRNRVIMHRCERGYKSDVAIANAGAVIVDIGDADGATEVDLIAAIDANTAAIFVHDAAPGGHIPLSRVIPVARAFKLPVIVDAAFSVPPVETLWRFSREMGADAVVVSGGKGLRGPQSTGLVLGRHWIIEGCVFHGAPNDRIGRGMKVGKEELAGVYAAVKLALARPDAEYRGQVHAMMDAILEHIRGLPGVAPRGIGGPRVALAIDPTRYNLTPTYARGWLLRETPSVYVEPVADGIAISTECMDQADARIVGERLRALFLAHLRA
jgi:seryl-tRNA(Sec) selenium transferase